MTALNEKHSTMSHQMTVGMEGQGRTAVLGQVWRIAKRGVEQMVSSDIEIARDVEWGVIRVSGGAEALQEFLAVMRGRIPAAMQSYLWIETASRSQLRQEMEVEAEVSVQQQLGEGQAQLQQQQQGESVAPPSTAASQKPSEGMPSSGVKSAGSSQLVGEAVELDMPESRVIGSPIEMAQIGVMSASQLFSVMLEEQEQKAEEIKLQGDSPVAGMEKQVTILTDVTPIQNIVAIEALLRVSGTRTEPIATPPAPVTVNLSSEPQIPENPEPLPVLPTPVVTNTSPSSGGGGGSSAPADPYTQLSLNWNLANPANTAFSSLQLWLDSNDLSTVTLNGNQVTGLADKGIAVATNNAAAPALSNAPVYGFSSSFGLKTLRLDGVDDYLRVLDADNLDNTNGLTMVAMITPTALNGYQNVILSKQSFNAGLQGEVWKSGSWINNINDAVALFSSTPTATFRSTTLDYPQASDNVSGNIGQFLGVDAGSLSNATAATLSHNDTAYRFSGYIDVPASGTYRFGVQSDDGFRLSINNNVMMEFSNPRGYNYPADTMDITLQQGRQFIEIAFYDRGGDIGLRIESNLFNGGGTNPLQVMTDSHSYHRTANAYGLYMDANQKLALAIGADNDIALSTATIQHSVDYVTTSVYDGANPDSNQRIQTYVNASNDSVRSNNLTAIGNTASDLLLGSLQNGFPNFLQGEIHEVLVFSSALSTADRQAIERYMAVKYGHTIDASVPSTGVPTVTGSSTALDRLEVTGGALQISLKNDAAITGVEYMDLRGNHASHAVAVRDNYFDTIHENTLVLDATGNTTGVIFSGTLLTNATKSLELKGSAVADILAGGAGKDTLTGGAGNDRFIFTKATDSGIGAGNRDIITDFGTGADVIDLSALYASGSFTFRAGGNGVADFSGTDPQLAFQQISGNTIVMIDTNGDGATNLEIQLTGIHTLTATSFVL